MRKNVLEYLESSARMHANKPAFCDENRVFTFGELLKAAQGLGTHLARAVDTLQAGRGFDRPHGRKRCRNAGRAVCGRLLRSD